MQLRKTTRPLDALEPEAWLDVLLEPLPGRSDADVLTMLAQQGAQDVAVLHPGFISAQIAPTTLSAAEAVAYVHPKRRHQLHQVSGQEARPAMPRPRHTMR